MWARGEGRRRVRAITSRWRVLGGGRVGRVAVREAVGGGVTGSRREGWSCGCEGWLEGRVAVEDGRRLLFIETGLFMENGRWSFSRDLETSDLRQDADEDWTGQRTRRTSRDRRVSEDGGQGKDCLYILQSTAHSFARHA